MNRNISNLTFMLPLMRIFVLPVNFYSVIRLSVTTTYSGLFLLIISCEVFGFKYPMGFRFEARVPIYFKAPLLHWNLFYNGGGINDNRSINWKLVKYTTIMQKYFFQ